MNTIYLIGYYSDVSEAYATDEEGIKQLALDWYWTGWDKEKNPVHVSFNMEDKTVTIYDKADADLTITYDVITFVRES